ncbi:urease accessory protein UreF [soil metagenome]
MSTDGAAMLRLMTWLSPAFPVGAFSYSHGLEQAVRDGAVTSEDALFEWLSDLITRGSAWNDAVLLAQAWRVAGDDARLAAVIELGAVLASCHERQRETMQQGAAFHRAATPWAGAAPDEEVPYPVAIGSTAGRGGTGLHETLIAYLHAFSGNLVSAAIRLGVIGQTGGGRVLEQLETVILATAGRAEKSSLGDLGSATFMSEITAMRHETLEPRLFRS